MIGDILEDIFELFCLGAFITAIMLWVL